MKRKLVCAIALMAVVTGGGMISAHAFLGPPDDFEGAPAGKMGPERHFARMAEVLKLTDAQKEQIGAILKAERERVAPLREKLAKNREKLQQAAESETLDEAAVRSLAAVQTNLQTELIVSRLKVRNQISALLSPEQRELAEKLRPLLHERHGRRPPCPEPEGPEM